MQKDYKNKTEVWKIGLFTFNNTATNCYMLLMNMISYYTFGAAGLLLSVLLNVATVMRIFDSFTDPIIGALIDRTNTKLGKCRPFIILGQIIMFLSVFVLMSFVNRISIKWLAYVAFIALYAVYILGYTSQCAITKVGQTILIRNSQQRPLFALFDSIYSTILFSLFGIIIPLLAKANNGLSNQQTFNQLMLVFIPSSIIFSILAIVGIWTYDNDKYFIRNKEPIKFKDFWPVLRQNKAIQMLIISAATDKLAQTLAGHTLIMTLLFAVILGDFDIQSKLAIPVSIITIVAIFGGTMLARKRGLKKAFVYYTEASIVAMLSFLIIMLLINPKGAALNLSSLKGIGFIIFYFLTKITMSLTGGIVIPMIADCTDYEASISGKYVPGLMATLFSFIDKLVSSLATSLISLLFIWAGTKEIDATTLYTNKLFLAFIIGYIVFPIVGYIITLIAMRFYPLNQKTMDEVEEKLSLIRETQSNETK